MHLVSPLLLAAFLGTVLGQFESADFNIAEALLDKDVNVSAIPGLSDLAGRSSKAGCSIAVSEGSLHSTSLSN